MCRARPATCRTCPRCSCPERRVREAGTTLAAAAWRPGRRRRGGRRHQSTGRVRSGPAGKVVAGGTVPTRDGRLRGHLVSWDFHAAVMLLRQPYVLLPSTGVQLEGDGFPAAGRLFVRAPRRLLCDGEKPFPFRTSMLKVTVNLSPAFGAHTQTVPVRRTPWRYHVHNSFCCSRSIVDFFFLFSIPQSRNFFVFQEIG